jgi:hypothetical protein
MVDDSESILEENRQLFVIRDELVLGFLPTRTSVMIIIHAIFIPRSYDKDAPIRLGARHTPSLVLIL